MSNFWSKQLGTPSPGGIVVPPQQPQPVYQQPATAPQQHVQQPQPHQEMTPQQQAILEAQQRASQNVDDPNRQLSLREAVTRWKGGEAWQKEGHLRCPGCNSATGYTQFSGNLGHAQAVFTERGQATPRGHCFECGYNGQYQQGLEASWA